ncbi:uncharacterized protein METZ01_LOCUS106467 [marine metagenome]|uniref:Uncharacterized protein n=1 Tax=marine metagenome TaxID=408172 RepID=A0A381WNZ3_9ZZZZ
MYEDFDINALTQNIAANNNTKKNKIVKNNQLNRHLKGMFFLF